MISISYQFYPIFFFGKIALIVGKLIGRYSIDAIAEICVGFDLNFLGNWYLNNLRNLNLSQELKWLKYFNIFGIIYIIWFRIEFRNLQIILWMLK